MDLETSDHSHEEPLLLSESENEDEVIHILPDSLAASNASPVVSVLARFKANRKIKEQRSCFEKLKSKFNRHWNSLRTPMEEEGLDFDPPYSKLYASREKEITDAHRQTGELMKWLTALTIALLVSGLAIAVDVSIRAIVDKKFNIIYGNSDDKDRARHTVLYFFGVNLACVAVASILVAFLDTRAKGSGIPEIKSYLNGRKIHRVIALRTIFSKLAGVIMSVSAGLIVGKEGPMIHAGGVAGAVISQGYSEKSYCGVHFRSDRHKRAFVSIGCACGIAAAFSAPLGGVLFVIEEAASYWSVKLTWVTFFAAIVCAATVDVFLSAINRDAQLGLMSQSSIISFGSFEGASRDPCYPEQLPYEFSQLAIFMAMGIVGGLAGAIFNTMNIYLAAWRQAYVSSPMSKVSEALLVSVVTSLVLFRSAAYATCRSESDVKFLDPSMNGIGYNASCAHMQMTGIFCTENAEVNDVEMLMMKSIDAGVRQLFHSKVLFTYDSLFTYFLALYLLGCFTYGTSIPSGLFVPAIAMGAAAGRLLGQFLYLDQWELFRETFGVIDPGTCALIGSAALLGGITRMTISIVVILIETTNNSTYAVPIMITIMAAKVTGDFFTEGLYDMHIKLNRIMFLHDEPRSGLHLIQVGECMIRNPVVMNLTETVADVLHKLEVYPTINGFPVISKLRDDRISNLSERSTLTKNSSSGSFHEYATGSTRFLERPSGDWTELDDDSSGSRGIFEGVILRSQLMILLYERMFRKPNEIGAKQQAMLPWRRMYKHYPRYPRMSEVLGRIRSSDLTKIVDLRPYVNSGALSVHHTTYMSRVHQLFRLLGLRHLTVVNTNNNVVGIVTRADIHHAENVAKRGCKKIFYRRQRKPTVQFNDEVTHMSFHREESDTSSNTTN